MSEGVFAHWPNRVTAIRFAGSLVLFVIFALWGERAPSEMGSAVPVAFWLFVLTAVTDVLDGWLARRGNLVTAFGRIADPFVDKVLVLGTLIFLATMDWSRGWVPAWVVVVILARELLVTGIRGYVESLGLEFPADRFGKLKMLLQCFAIGTILGVNAFPWTDTLRGLVADMGHVLVWATLVATVGSGLSYVAKTARLLAESPEA